MDIAAIASRLGLIDSNSIIRKAEELRRLSDVQFDSSIIGVGEVAKAVICLEIAASRLLVIFDRSSAIRVSGMSEKAYIRCFNAMQNGIGVKARLDVRELAVQFGCVRLISFVQKGFSLYKDRFLAALPASRRANTDFSRPVFTAVAFYLCAKKHKLKVDKFKLIELSGTSESEFLTIANSMNDLCFDVLGSSKEKKDPRAVKGHRELIDALPGKRTRQDDSDVYDDSSIDGEDDIELSCYKKHKKMEKVEYKKWKSSIISSNNKSKKAPDKRLRQSQLNFSRKLEGRRPRQMSPPPSECRRPLRIPPPPTNVATPPNVTASTPVHDCYYLFGVRWDYVSPPEVIRFRGHHMRKAKGDHGVRSGEPSRSARQNYIEDMRLNHTVSTPMKGVGRPLGPGAI